MTNLEISKALALAIGWTFRQVGENGGVFYVNTSDAYTWDNKWRVFDYRDWAVAGPIAERYDCFPYRQFDGQWIAWNSEVTPGCDTPQKAIALAVIGAKT